MIVFFQGFPKKLKILQKISPGRKIHYIIFQGSSKRKFSVKVYLNLQKPSHRICFAHSPVPGFCRPRTAKPQLPYPAVPA